MVVTQAGQAIENSTTIPVLIEPADTARIAAFRYNQGALLPAKTIDRMPESIGQELLPAIG